jgi:hypothetical protein
MAVPGWKALFFLRKDREICEDFGQKCELMDRNGQIYRLFFYLSSILSNVGRLQVLRGLALEGSNGVMNL